MKTSLVKLAAVCVVALSFCGCTGKTKEPEKMAAAPAPVAQAPMTLEQVNALPPVVLTGLKVIAVEGAPVTRIDIGASGAFGSNIVPKRDPVRLVAMVYNAEIGKAPKSIEVNDGTVKGVRIDQVPSGDRSAVRVTIELVKETMYRLTPGESAVSIEIKRAD